MHSLGQLGIQIFEKWWTPILPRKNTFPLKKTPALNLPHFMRGTLSSCNWVFEGWLFIFWTLFLRKLRVCKSFTCHAIMSIQKTLTERISLRKWEKNDTLTSLLISRIKKGCVPNRLRSFIIQYDTTHRCRQAAYGKRSHNITYN